MTVNDTATVEPSPQDLAWAAQYLRHPGKVAAARRYQQRQLDHPMTGPPETEHPARRLAALDVVLADADRCRECGKALKTKASRAAGIGPECASKQREANRG